MGRVRADDMSLREEVVRSENKEACALQKEREEEKSWFVMRDLTRSNAKYPAYRILEEKGITYFTPMTWKIMVHGSRRERQRVPVMHDLLFVYDTRAVLDPIVESIPTFQYRFARNTGGQPMTVRTIDMERFIRAVESTDTPRYYRPEEITPTMNHRRIRMIGGNLDGYEGFLLTTRGSKVKRLLVELPMFLAASVEVQTEYIQFL